MHRRSLRGLRPASLLSGYARGHPSASGGCLPYRNTLAGIPQHPEVVYHIGMQSRALRPTVQLLSSDSHRAPLILVRYHLLSPVALAVVLHLLLICKHPSRSRMNIY